jgi:hypothetical protein
MTIQPNDLILEIIGTPKTPLQIPNAVQTEIWSDARIGDATLHIRLESPAYATAALEYIKAQGLTPIGARVIEPRVTPIRTVPAPRTSFLKKLGFARAA